MLNRPSCYLSNNVASLKKPNGRNVKRISQKRKERPSVYVQSWGHTDYVFDVKNKPPRSIGEETWQCSKARRRQSAITNSRFVSSYRNSSGERRLYFDVSFLPFDFCTRYYILTSIKISLCEQAAPMRMNHSHVGHRLWRIAQVLQNDHGLFFIVNFTYNYRMCDDHFNCFF